MSLTYLNFATGRFRGLQALAARSARRCGCARVLTLSPSDIDSGFRASNEALLSASRGAGYWLWKPHLVLNALNDLPDGDFLIYADSGVIPVAPLHPLRDYMRDNELRIMILGEGHSEHQYTRRDAFVLMDADEDRYVSSPQRYASVLVFEAGQAAREFVSEWLALCCDPRIVSDQDNVCGLPNYPGFVDHRHDQSVLSLLSKKHGLPVASENWIAGGFPRPAGQLFNHPRLEHAPGSLAAKLMSWNVISLRDVIALSLSTSAGK